MSPKGVEYESLIDELVRGLRYGTSLESDYRQGQGAKNRIAGASGYKHQIDVSIHGENDI